MQHAKSEQIVVRVDPSLRKALARLAERDKRTVSAYIRLVLLRIIRRNRAA